MTNSTQIEITSVTEWQCVTLWCHLEKVKKDTFWWLHLMFQWRIVWAWGRRPERWACLGIHALLSVMVKQGPERGKKINFRSGVSILTRSLREPGGPCTKSMEVSESRMERVKQNKQYDNVCMHALLLVSCMVHVHKLYLTCVRVHVGLHVCRQCRPDEIGLLLHTCINKWIDEMYM